MDLADELAAGALADGATPSLLREHYLSGAPAVEAVTVEAAAPDVADVDVGELDIAQLRALAERGDADAQSELGGRYEAGEPDRYCFAKFRDRLPMSTASSREKAATLFPSVS